MAFPRILVVIDDVTREFAGLVARAASLAARDGVVHVVAPVFDAALDLLAEGDEALLREGRAALLAAVAARLEAGIAGVAHRPDVIVTFEAAWIAAPAPWIADTVRAGGFALVVLPEPAGLVPATAAFADAVLRAARVPVWLVRETSRGPVQGAIVGAVDVVAADAREARLARRVAGTAALLARQAGGDAGLVTVLPVSPLLARCGLVDVDARLAAARSRLAPGLADIAADAGIPAAGTDLLAGDPAAAIAGVAREREAALVVLGTRLSSGIASRLFGGTNLRLLGHWAGDLLIVPDEA